MLSCKCGLFTASLLTVLVGILFNSDCFGDFFLPQLPNINVSDNWGSRNNNETVVKQIVIKVPDATLQLLMDRIKTRSTAISIKNVNFSYGFNVDYHNILMNYWMTNYNWREWEDIINRFPHYFTNINGLQIHFIHIKPSIESNKTVIPILLLHGWPGSFFEFYKLIPLLSSSLKSDLYEYQIICPSLVGYGWSDGSEKPGFGLIEMGDTMFKLMNRLNITRKFYIQGGDWGSIIAGAMSNMYPDKIAGIHINMIETPLYDLRYLIKVMIGSILPKTFHFLTEQEQNMVYPWKEKMNLKIGQMAYVFMQATRPNTIGIALTDSPSGLAAYILEKFGSWSNNLSYHLSSPHGGIEDCKISKDEMLTNIMIYYITSSITSSITFYKEVFAEDNIRLMKIPIKIPTAIAVFPYETFILPKSLAQIKYRNIKQFTYMPRGGHFGALEEPELLAKDIHSFVILTEKE